MSKLEKFYSLSCYHAELFSKDPNTKVAAMVIDKNHNILSVGYNGLPRGFEETKERWSKPTKYQYVVHAEANAICTAARNGAKLEGGSIVSTLFPCDQCARLIIQAGIKKVVTARPEENSSWLQSFWYSKEMFDECGVEIEYVPSISTLL
ncbi:dCMP deaminase [Acanthocystis turfacea Chlorella virus TN603.4.2]|nr:dCMP deaminase [Acanthocystis turfacea Chlorella virus TN603.4.2]